MAPLYPELSRSNVPGLHGESINTPPPEDFNTQAMQGSLQQLLSENLGEFVIIEFLIGTQNIMRKQGILYAVGRSVVTLFEETSQTFVTCDIFSVKFVTFYQPNQRPGTNITFDVTTGRVVPSSLGLGAPIPGRSVPAQPAAAGSARAGNQGMAGAGQGTAEDYQAGAMGSGCVGPGCAFRPMGGY